METLSEYILCSADWAVENQSEQGTFEPGMNGPHNHRETPVRNTATWLISLLWAYDTTNKKKYLDAAERSLSYLHSNEARPGEGGFDIRRAKYRPPTAELNAQVWVLASLIDAYEILDDEESFDLATNVFYQHPFSNNLGLWQIIDLDGEPAFIDKTLNHQIAFAVIGARIADHRNDKTLDEHIHRFMNVLPRYAIQYDDNTLSTRFPYSIRIATDALFDDNLELTWAIFRSRTKRFLKRLTGVDLSAQNEEREKAIGYQGYHLFRLAQLARLRPEHSLWSSDLIKNALLPVQNKEFSEKVAKSKYGFSWNPSGFEIAYALETFSKDTNLAEYWVREQMRRHYDIETGTLSADTPYDKILAARIYVATYLCDYDIDGFD